MSFDIASAGLIVFPLLLAVVCHEWAHGYVAYRLGDDTAKRAGRLTLNPIPHIDPFGTILMPALLFMSGVPFLFGYAKPVPVSWGRLGNPMRDMVWVAAAGPAMNLALAVASAIVLRMLVTVSTSLASAAPDMGEGAVMLAGFEILRPLATMCYISMQINLVLAVFNLLPIPPLDGGRVAVGLLPREVAYKLAQVEPYGFFIVFGLLVTGALGTILRPVMNVLMSVLGVIL